MSTQSIIFNKDLLSINPAYNNSIIEYYSGLLMSDVTYSEIAIGATTFKVYPVDGVFTYNFKEVAKVLINQNNFSDTIVPNLAVKYIYDDSTLALTLSPTIKIYDATTAETITKDYNFLKNVEQLVGYKEKSAINKDVRILLPSTNYTDYSVNYFEGYPNDFSIYGLVSGDTFFFRNVSTLNQSTTFTSNNTDAKRVFFSDGGTNEYTTVLLNLSSTTNLVELWVNSSFKANIKIKRINSKSGVYLKWFNASGGYSYWLFDEIFSDTLNTKTIDEINGAYGNLQSITNTGNITGKNGNRTYKLTTKFAETEKEHLASILLSPMVEMYIYNTPFNQTDTAKFIGVKVNDGSSTFNNKYSNYKMDITITLPELFTQTL